jgi:HPt (histidine-containing phosphotransfer) domain-containing protein
VERTAHTLKGSVSNFAFPAAFYNLQKLENLGREGDLGEAAELFAAVEAQLETLQSSLASFQKEQVA